MIFPNYWILGIPLLVSSAWAIHEFWQRKRQQRDLEELSKRLQSAEGDLRQAEDGARALLNANARLQGESAEGKQTKIDAARLSAILEGSPDAIFGKDLNGIIEFWNSGAEKMYGYSAKEMLGKPVSLLIPLDRLAELDQIFSKIRQGMPVERLETARVTKAGQRIDVVVTVSPVFDQAGAVIGASTIARDITDRKLVKQALKNSEEQYRLFFEANPIPTFVVDRDTLAFLAVNESAVLRYGYSRDEFLRMSVRDIQPLEEVSSLVTSFPDDEASNLKLCRHEKKNGELIDVELTSHRIDIDSMKADLILANDITERKRSEESLRQMEERFYKAFRSSPLAISISTQEDGKYLDVNDAFLKMLGYERRDVIGKTVSQLKVWANVEKREVVISTLSRAGTISAFETHFNTRTNEQKLVQVSAEVIRLDNRPCILAIIQDVTEAKQLEEQLRHAQKMEAVGRLAGGVAHDFSNLMGIIIGYSELAQERLDANHPVRKHVDQIRAAGELAALLTRQLLGFSRQQVLQPRIVDLNAVVKNLSKMLLRILGEDVTLVFRSGADLGSVKADLGQIEQVLMNLVVNSRDAMPEGGKIFVETANVELDLEFAKHYQAEPGSYVMLSVSDTGCGMDTKTLSRIFEPFFTTKNPGQGTGLGLSMVYGVVNQNGGFIEVHSEPLKGTTFKVYLPRAEESSQDIGETRSQAVPAGGSETVLLVEDDSPFRKLATDLLGSSGYRVIEAENGQVAIEMLKQSKETVHLLLTDVIMPGMNGSDLAMHCRFIRPDLKILFMSGYTGELIAHHGVLDTDTAFVAKPFSKKSLLGKVRSVLDASRVAAGGRNGR